MSQELIKADIESSDALVRLCSWCRRMQHDTTWVDLQADAVQQRIFAHSVPPQVTHGICEECARCLLESVTHR